MGGGAEGIIRLAAVRGGGGWGGGGTSVPALCPRHAHVVPTLHQRFFGTVEREF